MTGEEAEACLLAQNLARNAGFAVFPCRADKSPATRRGFKDASKDPDQIAALWRLHPGPLVGIATGAVSDLCVLDLDIKFPDAVAWWRANHKRLPQTRIFRTRSGGLHVYFRYRRDVGCSAGKIALGVDTRGDGGYVISWLCAGLECIRHDPPAPWPDWLAEALNRRKEPPPRTAQIDTAKAGRALDGVLAVVANASEGTRNQIIFWGASRFAERRVPVGEAEALLVAAARAAGLADVEARRTIRSAYRLGA